MGSFQTIHTLERITISPTLALLPLKIVVVAYDSSIYWGNSEKIVLSWPVTSSQLHVYSTFRALSLEHSCSWTGPFIEQPSITTEQYYWIDRWRKTVKKSTKRRLCFVGYHYNNKKKTRPVPMDAGSVQTKHKEPAQRLKHGMHVHPGFNIPLYHVP